MTDFVLLDVLRRGRSLAVAVLAAALWAPVAQAQTSVGPPASALTDLKWSDLVPAGWDPSKALREHVKDPNFSAINDGDPRMLDMLKQLREVWDNAPVNPAMDGVHGRVPGYVVPLEEGSQGLREMLLVPYYGACIHSPPPPANQIIHVVLSKPAKGFSMMNTVWVTGTLKVVRGTSYMGASGYKIDGATLAPYVKGQPIPIR
jgi:uncharacterized protein